MQYDMQDMLNTINFHDISCTIKAFKLMLTSPQTIDAGPLALLAPPGPRPPAPLRSLGATFAGDPGSRLMLNGNLDQNAGLIDTT